LGPRFRTSNGILIGSSVLAQLTVVNYIHRMQADKSHKSRNIRNNLSYLMLCIAMSPNNNNKIYNYLFTNYIHLRQRYDLFIRKTFTVDVCAG